MFSHPIYGDLPDEDPIKLQTIKKLPLNPYPVRIGLAFMYWLFELPLNVKITNLLLLLSLLLLLLLVVAAKITDIVIIVTATEMIISNFLLFTIDQNLYVISNMASF
jgi:hypothetical protein